MHFFVCWNLELGCKEIALIFMNNKVKNICGTKKKVVEQ